MHEYPGQLYIFQVIRYPTDSGYDSKCRVAVIVHNGAVFSRPMKVQDKSIIGGSADTAISANFFGGFINAPSFIYQRKQAIIREKETPKLFS